MPSCGEVGTWTGVGEWGRKGGMSRATTECVGLRTVGHTSAVVRGRVRDALRVGNRASVLKLVPPGCRAQKGL